MQSEPFWPLASWAVLRDAHPSRSVADTDRRGYPDLEAAETALTGLLGVRKRIRMRDVRFAHDTCSSLGKPAMSSRVSRWSYLGEMPFELVSSVRVENIYSDFCGTVGRVYTRGSKPHWPKQAEVQVPT